MQKFNEDIEFIDPVLPEYNSQPHESAEYKKHMMELNKRIDKENRINAMSACRAAAFRVCK